MQRFGVVAVVAVAILAGVFAPRAAAQNAPASVPPGPRLAPEWQSFQPPHSAQALSPVDLLVQQRRSRAPGTVFMIVGGAVALVGLFAEESLLVIGGVAVAGYGLYLYMR